MVEKHTGLDEEAAGTASTMQATTHQSPASLVHILFTSRINNQVVQNQKDPNPLPTSETR
jgi:hypothetical protein